jgi:hypothetical protein
MGSTLRGTIHVFTVLSVVLWPAVCQAQRPGHAFRVWGAGTVSCGEWTKNRSPSELEPAAQMSNWLLGFITGYNAYRSETPDIASTTDMAGLEGWIDNYCLHHPLDPLFQAAGALLVELRDKAGPKD